MPSEMTLLLARVTLYPQYKPSMAKLMLKPELYRIVTTTKLLYWCDPFVARDDLALCSIVIVLTRYQIARVTNLECSD